jgi:hypothetical protein
MVDMKYSDEYIAEYLGHEDNENLVKSKANTESFQAHKQTTSTDVKDVGTRKNKDGKYDPNDKDVIREAKDRGIEPEDLISFWEMRDKKMFGSKEKEGEN